MKGYTNLEQSKKLSEFLPIESSDMNYWCGTQIRIGGYRAMDKDLDIPCWSLAALLDVLNKTAYFMDEDASVNLSSYKTIEWDLGIDNSDLELVTESNPVDACYEMIIKLHEQKLL